MTAEISILNKEAVAIAADSAVTFNDPYRRGQKIFTSANKIFALSKFVPVVIMFWGNATLMGVPWETIVKLYRIKIGKTRFNSLDKYCEDFISFLKTGYFIPEKEKQKYFLENIYKLFLSLKDDIENQWESFINDKGEISEKEALKIALNIIKYENKTWEKSPSFDKVPKNIKKTLSRKYGKILKKTKKNIFENLISKSRYISELLNNIAFNMFSKIHPYCEKAYESGMAITGFGDREIFPSINSYFIDGIIEKVLVYTKNKEKSHKITFDKTAAIIPFAQDEMVASFIEGIEPECYNNMLADFHEILLTYPEIILENIKKISDSEKITIINNLKKISKKLIDNYTKKLQHYRFVNNVVPILSVVNSLPKDELAAMAESLVNLTSFKRRVSMTSETVGGPIDVAVISKKDGLIWVKRKHYFSVDMNQHYFNYYKQDEKNDKKTSK